MKECSHAPDALLLRLGELDFWSAQRARLHMLTCRACRHESTQLLRSATQLQLSLARPHSVVPRVRRVGVAPVAKYAMGLVVIAVLVYAARVTVDAAVAEINRPHSRPANYTETPPLLSHRNPN